MTVRTILVPVRGDGKGEGVLDHALSFGGRYAAHLEVVHCRPRPEDLLPFGVSVPAILRKDIRGLLRAPPADGRGRAALAL
jgi:hypothetical protein